MTILLFPGQGSEVPEMGLALARVDAHARRLLEVASEACGLDVRRALERGSRAMARTEVVQPAIVAVSLAMARAVEGRGAAIACVLGHSLGELAALSFALDVADDETVRIAALRGRVMADAAAACPGAMIAVTARDAPRAPGLAYAAHNAPDEHVLSGPIDAIACAERSLAPRARRLAVAGAWHSRAMEPALEPLRNALRPFSGRRARCVAISALDGARIVDGDAATNALVEGLVRPVQWTGALAAARATGAGEMLAVAPSRVVRSLARRTLGASCVVQGVDGPADLGALASVPR